jgi:hypothetical protein
MVARTSGIPAPPAGATGKSSSRSGIRDGNKEDEMANIPYYNPHWASPTEYVMSLRPITPVAQISGFGGDEVQVVVREMENINGDIVYDIHVENREVDGTTSRMDGDEMDMRGLTADSMAIYVGIMIYRFGGLFSFASGNKYRAEWMAKEAQMEYNRRLAAS